MYFKKYSQIYSPLVKQSAFQCRIAPIHISSRHDRRERKEIFVVGDSSVVNRHLLVIHHGSSSLFIRHLLGPHDEYGK